MLAASFSPPGGPAAGLPGGAAAEAAGAPLNAALDDGVPATGRQAILISSSQPRSGKCFKVSDS